jgi:hypothetical protein
MPQTVFAKDISFTALSKQLAVLKRIGELLKSSLRTPTKGSVQVKPKPQL